MGHTHECKHNFVAISRLPGVKVVKNGLPKIGRGGKVHTPHYKCLTCGDYANRYGKPVGQR